MGNKIVKLNASSSNTSFADKSRREVYVDISMVSKSSINNDKPDINDEKYKLFVLLAQEHPDTLTTQDLVLTEHEKELIELYYGIDEKQFERDYALFLFKAKYWIDKKVDVRAVQGSIHNIFTWIPGERILNPEFGSNLRKLLYEGITLFNVELIVAEIRHCVSVWEPRVLITKVVNVGTLEDTEDNVVHIEVQYTIPGLTQDQVYSEPIVYKR